jgi:hypothetical protein
VKEKENDLVVKLQHCSGTKLAQVATSGVEVSGTNRPSPNAAQVASTNVQNFEHHGEPALRRLIALVEKSRTLALKKITHCRAGGGQMLPRNEIE